VIMGVCMHVYFLGGGVADLLDVVSRAVPSMRAYAFTHTPRALCMHRAIYIYTLMYT